MSDTHNLPPAASPDNPYDLIVIGAGPGGYVAAIRAAQLGMRVACIDRQFLGGTCLNVGCIPSKALLDSSERFYEAKNKLAHHGIKVGDVSLDLPTMLGRKDQVVKQLTGGVGYLFKKNKVDAFIGTGRIVCPDTVEVKPNRAQAAPQTLKTKHILIATGSAPIELPGLTFDGKYVVGSTEALSFNRSAEEAARRRRRVHRPGAGLGLEPARVGSPRPRIHRRRPAADGPGTEPACCSASWKSRG